jgi:hypothetical protein
MDEWRSRAGGFGMIALALFLILFGFTALVGLAIPAWVGALLALLAGILLLVGK